MTRPGRTAIAVFGSIVGLALLAWQVRLAHVDRIRDGFSAVGYGFIGILALSGLRYVARALAWTTLMGGGIGLGRATAAVVGGDALGNLTPLRLLASEPAKALLLGRGVVTSRALAALVAENVFYSASVACVIILGTGAMLIAFALPDEVRWLGWTSLALMATTLLMTLVVIGRRPAIASTVLRRVPGLESSRVELLVARVRDFETSTYDFVAGHATRLIGVVACEIAFHVLSFGETYLTLWLLTGHSSPLSAFVLDTVNRIINVAFMMVPLRVGVAETGTGLVADAIGVGQAVGVTMALVGKVRVLVWAVIGLVLMGRYRESFLRTSTE
ncbi:MAG TPA: lysylphosphatidylglycerol synthase transmembrane domain-containing protein [Vicinamibacterales bacterium]